MHKVLGKLRENFNIQLLKELFLSRRDAEETDGSAMANCRVQ